MNLKEAQPAPVELGTPNPEGSNHTPKIAKRNVVLVVSTIIGIILLVLTLNFFHILSLPKFLKPKSISKPVPVTTILAKGVLTAINGTNIVVTVYGQPQTFSIAGTRDFQRVISGTIRNGDAKVDLSSASALKVGQEVLIIADKGSTQAKTVYILGQQ